MNGDGLGDVAVPSAGAGRVRIWRGAAGSYLSTDSNVLRGGVAPPAEHFGSAMAF
jgi:hypothetical protein